MNAQVTLTPEQVELRATISGVFEKHIPQLVNGAGYNGCTCGGVYLDHHEHLVAMIAQAVEQRRAVPDRRFEALSEVAADLNRNHDMPPRKDNRSYSYRNGWWDGVHHAAKVVERAARAIKDDTTGDGL